MYLVLEIQKDANGNLATLITQHATSREAQSKYHTVLGFAAQSTLPRHGAAIIAEDGHTLEYKSFKSEAEAAED